MQALSRPSCSACAPRIGDAPRRVTRDERGSVAHYIHLLTREGSIHQPAYAAFPGSRSIEWMSKHRALGTGDHVFDRADVSHRVDLFDMDAKYATVDAKSASPAYVSPTDP